MIYVTWVVLCMCSDIKRLFMVCLGIFCQGIYTPYGNQVSRVIRLHSTPSCTSCASLITTEECCMMLNTLLNCCITLMFWAFINPRNYRCHIYIYMYVCVCVCTIANYTKTVVLSSCFAYLWTAPFQWCAVFLCGWIIMALSFPVIMIGCMWWFSGHWNVWI